MSRDFPIPDLVLRDAYIEVARKVGMYREKFAARTENIQAVLFKLGPQYAHVPIDAIRDRIISCAKQPDKHGGGWSVTNGHGKSKATSKPSWYDEYLLKPHWTEMKRKVLDWWGHSCAICFARSHLEVHHRHYSSLGSEKLQDCICLCSKCHKRHHKWMMQPEQMEQASHTLF